MKYYYIGIFSFLFLLSCTSKDNGAQAYLDNARKYYNEQQYDLAKLELDSLRANYPTALPQLKQRLLLIDSIRRGENERTITLCDSLISIYQPELEKAQKLFIYQRNKQYQESGDYIPRESVSSGAITASTLRSGVTESGQLFIESVLIGAQKHNKLKITVKGGTSVESIPVNDDGLNYRFSNMGKSYEVIRFIGADENGIGKFIAENEKSQLTATLSGAGKYSYTLPQSIKASITKSYKLSTIMLQLDSLKTEKEKAQFYNYNLDQKKEAQATGESNIQNIDSTDIK